MKVTRFPPTTKLATLLSWALLVAFGAAVAFGWQAVPARSGGTGLADGIAALRVNDYASARHVFQVLADKNDPAGELWLAHLYQEGLGVAPDAQQAVTLLTKAADAGSAEAAGRLGKLYLDGDGVLQDVGAAQAWLNRAAQGGDAAAQRELGLLYEHGLGTAKDPRKAYVWLDIAARNGDAQARLSRDRVLATLTPDDAAHAAAEAADTLRPLIADAQSGRGAGAKDDANTAPHAVAPIKHS
jgi:TPR repeat protein